MDVKIMSVVAGEPPRVQFACSVGQATATWWGDTPPDVGHIYDVEIDVEGEPEWGRNLRLASGSDRLPDVLPGVIEAYDADGMVLRLGGEGLTQLTPTGDPPIGATAGAAVQIERPSLTLWPTDI